MKIIIDRIENNHAIAELEDGTFANLPIAFIPTGARTGDVIQIEINRSATKEKREQATDLMNRVFED